MKLALVASVVLMACRPAVQVAPGPNEYWRARALFRTELKIAGPSPQEGEPLRPPPGASMVPYRSRGLDLAVMVSDFRKTLNLRPAVVFLHGGFAYSNQDWEEATPFVDAGFVLAMPILRGENGLPGSFSLLYDEVSDVLAATEVVAKMDGVDPRRIFVAGHSTGGALAMLAAESSSRFRGAAALSPSDVEALVRQSPALAPFDPQNADELRMRSYAAFVPSLRCPARIYVGADEWTVAAMKQVATSGQESLRDLETIVVPGDHLTMIRPGVTRAVEFFRTLAQ